MPSHRDALVGVVADLEELCRRAVQTVSVSGASVSLMSPDGSAGVVAASDDRSMSVGELPFAYGEGPALDAVSARRPVLVPDLRAESSGRWPGYTRSALLSGVNGVFALPLHVGAAELGVLDVYADEPGPLGSERMGIALATVKDAIRILVDGDLVTVGGQLEPDVSTALDYRGEIYQAQGMVMVDLGVDQVEALARMRAFAYAHDQTLKGLAHDVIAGLDLGEVLEP